MDCSQESPSRKIIILFLLKYRFLALGYTAFLGVTGLRAVPIASFIIALIYNAIVFKYRSYVLEKLRKYPYLIAADLVLLAILEWDAGPYLNPYYLYSYSPLFLGGFLFGYSGAFLLSVAQSLLLTSIDYFAGDHPSTWFANIGLHFTTITFIYIFFAIINAYLSNLLDKFEAANKERETANIELEKARKQVHLSRSFNHLSPREMQILILSFRGKTIDQIASELDITMNTVKTYLKRIYGKLGVSSKQEAISLVMRNSNEAEL